MKYDDAIMLLNLERNKLMLSGEKKDYADALGEAIAALIDAKTRALHLFEAAGGGSGEKA